MYSFLSPSIPHFQLNVRVNLANEPQVLINKQHHVYRLTFSVVNVHCLIFIIPNGQLQASVCVTAVRVLFTNVTSLQCRFIKFLPMEKQLPDHFLILWSRKYCNMNKGVTIMQRKIKDIVTLIN